MGITGMCRSSVILELSTIALFLGILWDIASKQFLSFLVIYNGVHYICISAASRALVSGLANSAAPLGYLLHRPDVVLFIKCTIWLLPNPLHIAHLLHFLNVSKCWSSEPLIDICKQSSTRKGCRVKDLAG